MAGFGPREALTLCPLLARQRSDNGCASGAPSTSLPGGGRIHPLEHFLQPRAIR